MKGVFYFKLNKWNENKELSSLRVPHIYYLTQPFNCIISFGFATNLMRLSTRSAKTIEKERDSEIVSLVRSPS